MDSVPIFGLCVVAALKVWPYAVAGQVLEKSYGLELANWLLFGVVRAVLGVVGGIIALTISPLDGFDLTWYGVLALVRLILWAASIAAFFGIARPLKLVRDAVVCTGFSYMCDLPFFLLVPFLWRTSC